MKRDNHYEAAFEWFLRDRGVGFVAVDEARRSLLGDESVKSLDFIIVGPHDAKLVVDVKGRQFPGVSGGKLRKVWQNWAEAEDIDGLERWAERFGPAFRGVLAFVYHVLPCVELPPDTPDLFAFRDHTYLARGVEVGEYRARMKRRSPRWDTVHLPAADFRELVRPFSWFLNRLTAEDAKNAERKQSEQLEQCRSD
jgi:hypothetical protein